MDAQVEEKKGTQQCVFMFYVANPPHEIANIELSFNIETPLVKIINGN